MDPSSEEGGEVEWRFDESGDSEREYNYGTFEELCVSFESF